MLLGNLVVTTQGNRPLQLFHERLLALELDWWDLLHCGECGCLRLGLILLRRHGVGVL